MKEQEKKMADREIFNEGMNVEDEQLELDDLIHVQGGQNVDDKTSYCGLGCYVGGLTPGSVKESKDEQHQ